MSFIIVKFDSKLTHATPQTAYIHTEARAGTGPL